jgi:hypothetical protein
MEIDAKVLAILSVLSSVFFPLFILCVLLCFEKRKAIEVVSHYDTLLGAKISQRELNQIAILEPDSLGMISSILKLIHYVPFLPCAGVLKHLKDSLKKSKRFVDKCNETDNYVFEANVGEILAQRDACITFYFMAEMLTCNSLKYRKRFKAWEQDSSYVKKYFTNLLIRAKVSEHHL